MKRGLMVILIICFHHNLSLKVYSFGSNIPFDIYWDRIQHGSEFMIRWFWKTGNECQKFFSQVGQARCGEKKINSHVELVLKFQRDWETVSRLLICTFSWFYDQEKTLSMWPKVRRKEGLLINQFRPALYLR